MVLEAKVIPETNLLLGLSVQKFDINGNFITKHIWPVLHYSIFSRCVRQNVRLWESNEHFLLRW
jgi:hypothetical protein